MATAINVDSTQATLVEEQGQPTKWQFAQDSMAHDLWPFLPWTQSADGQHYHLLAEHGELMVLLSCRLPKSPLTPPHEVPIL
jgi:hypothetical protein